MSLNGDGIPMNMPVVPAGTNNGNGWGGFGGDNGWWIILFFIVLMGWNRNGWGGNNGSGAADNYVLASDFATLQRQIDSAASTLERKGEITQQGLCDGFYAMNTTLLNGFAGVNQNMNTGFQSAELSRCNQQAALMQQLNAMQMQAANCCCENRASIAQVRYDMATQACDTRNTVQNTTRDIIDAMNCGFRSIDQRLTAQELAAKDAKIAEQNQQLFVAQLAASQNAQTLDLRNYVSGQLAYYNPRPVPAFSVPAPYQYAGCNSGYNYGCGNCA
jgi:hypothetical protein|nr:MAG TPA: hypothetical protein [Caudoviricetes sp.]